MHVVLDLPNPNSQLGEAFVFLDGIKKDDSSNTSVMRLHN